jgi:hypothetical protein
MGIRSRLTTVQIIGPSMAPALRNGDCWVVRLGVSISVGDVVRLTSVLFAHILLADRALARAHPLQFKHETRWFGIGAIVLGLAAAYFLPPASDIVLGIATAFLGGGLLMTTFREELPSASRARLPWFLLGTAVMTGLLLAALAISSRVA